MRSAHGMRLLARAARALCALSPLLLVACVPMAVRQGGEPTPAALAAQDAREQALRDAAHWVIQARIAVSGANGGSGDLLWRQDGAAYAFSVRGANGKTLRLSGDNGHAQLEGVDAQPDVGTDPQTLLRDRLGTEIPFAALRRWVLGLRLVGVPAQMRFGPDNLPVQIEQNGWTVEYLDWFDDSAPRLPKKVFATHGKDKVKLLIQSWNLD